VSRRTSDVDDEARRGRQRRSPGPLPSPAIASNVGGIDRRLKPRVLVGTAAPEDLRAARGLALLRLTPVKVPGAGSPVRSASDVGAPPWDLPSLKAMPSEVYGTIISNESYCESSISGHAGKNSPLNSETAGEDIISGNSSNLDGGSDCAPESVLEFCAELWIRGPQRPDPFLDKLLAGRIFVHLFESEVNECLGSCPSSCFRVWG
jgi:hypothetical protein